MKKLTRILALTLCCLLAAGLAACGETPAPTPDPDPDPNPDPDPHPPFPPFQILLSPV